MIPTTTRRLRVGAATAGLALIAVAAIVVAVVAWPRGERDATPPDVPTEALTADTAAPPPAGGSVPEGSEVPDVPEVPASTLVASFASDIARFEGPDGERVGTVPATWHDRPSILPVIDQVPGWLEVRLPQRPNGSTAWVRRDDVELASTPYRVQIDVATMRLKLFENGVEVMDAPAGIGTDAAPTTVGEFFLAFKQRPPNTTSGWGPFVLVTSSHSETISDFQQSGDAIAAIHGPLGAADRIGDSGAKVSHGCIRLHLEHLAQLEDLPAGTPIDVIDSAAGKRSSALFKIAAADRV